MGIRITGDKRECRVLVKDAYEISAAREKTDILCESADIIAMPDDFLRNNLGYEMVFGNRHSLKEFLCFEGFGEEQFDCLMKCLKELFAVSEENGLNPYSFVFDISCIFTEKDGKNYRFVYTPDCVTETNNACADLISLVSLYSGFETDSKEEAAMRKMMELVREWEKDYFERGLIRYDFPYEPSKGKNDSKRRDARLVCILKEKPYIMFFSSKKREKEICRIGRDINWADIKINMRFSSRHHAEITYENNCFEFCDLESTNGSVLNGTKVTPGKRYQMKGINKVVVGKEKKMVFLCF